MVAKYNPKVKQGGVFGFTVRWENDDGTPFQDITGWTARMQVRTTARADDAAFEVTDAFSSLGVADINGPDAEVNVLLEAAATVLLTRPEYVFDLFIYQPAPGDDEVCLVEGTMKVSPRVTR